MQIVVSVSWRESLRQLIFVMRRQPEYIEALSSRESSDLVKTLYHLEDFWARRLPLPLETILDKGESQELKSYVWRVGEIAKAARVEELSRALEALAGPQL